MIRYLSLISFTEDGIKNAKESIRRADKFRSLVEKAGGKVHSQYWSLGHKDGAVIFQVPDDKIGASLLLHLAHEGFVRTETLRVFNEDEFRSVLERL